ncbi:MAG TPA: hypothetical protein VFZ41_09810 [Solirubrobacterales bacterium]
MGENAMRLACLTVLVTVAGGPHALAAGTQVADCETDPTFHGSGRADWRRSSEVGGPLGVRTNPLRSATMTPSGQFVTKMPVLIEGHRAVTLNVPPRLRHRVFLYYGTYRDRRGRRTTGFRRARGFSVVEFRPCAGKPRTIWPGGIRVRGRRPVRLTVTVEGRPDPIPLRLGRPIPYRPRRS